MQYVKETHQLLKCSRNNSHKNELTYYLDNFYFLSIDNNSLLRCYLFLYCWSHTVKIINLLNTSCTQVFPTNLSNSSGTFDHMNQRHIGRWMFDRLNEIFSFDSCRNNFHILFEVIMFLRKLSRVYQVVGLSHKSGTVKAVTIK